MTTWLLLDDSEVLHRSLHRKTSTLILLEALANIGDFTVTKLKSLKVRSLTVTFVTCVAHVTYVTCVT